MNWKLFYKTMIFCVCLALFQNRALPVIACSPAGPSSWFRETFIVGGYDLPADVIVRLKSETYKFDEETSNIVESIEILNHSDIPLYLLMPRQRYYGAVDFSVQLPPDMDAYNKIVANELFGWWLEEDCVGDKCAGSWKSIQQSNEDRGKFIIKTAELAKFIPDLKDLNIRADDRPDDVEIPPSQQVSLMMVYDDQLVAIPISIVYALNERYNPSQGRDGSRRCAESYDDIPRENEGGLSTETHCFITGLVMMIVAILSLIIWEKTEI